MCTFFCVLARAWFAGHKTATRPPDPAVSVREVKTVCGLGSLQEKISADAINAMLEDAAQGISSRCFFPCALSLLDVECQVKSWNLRTAAWSFGSFASEPNWYDVRCIDIEYFLKWLTNDSIGPAEVIKSLKRLCDVATAKLKSNSFDSLISLRSRHLVLGRILRQSFDSKIR